MLYTGKMGSPKIRSTFLGVPIIRITVFWGLYWGTPIEGNHQVFNFFMVTLHVLSDCYWVGTPPRVSGLGLKNYLEGGGDLVRSISPITHIITLVITVIPS